MSVDGFGDRTLGRYELEGEVGRGGSSVVYRGRALAIKVLWGGEEPAADTSAPTATPGVMVNLGPDFAPARHFPSNGVDHAWTTNDTAPNLGRPVVHSPREDRNAFLHLLDEYGPGVGLPTLKDCFPDMLHAEQADLLRRYRRVWRERHRIPLRVLHWPEPDRVWAIDFTEAATLIDGRFQYLLAVRDLASGRSLLWRAGTAADVERGPPLLTAALAAAPTVAARGPCKHCRRDQEAMHTLRQFRRLRTPNGKKSPRVSFDAWRPVAVHPNRDHGAVAKSRPLSTQIDALMVKVTRPSPLRSRTFAKSTVVGVAKFDETVVVVLPSADTVMPLQFAYGSLR
jgi:hypothetical protein